MDLLQRDDLVAASMTHGAARGYPDTFVNVSSAVADGYAVKVEGLAGVTAHDTIAAIVVEGLNDAENVHGLASEPW